MPDLGLPGSIRKTGIGVRSWLQRDEDEVTPVAWIWSWVVGAKVAVAGDVDAPAIPLPIASEYVGGASASESVDEADAVSRSVESKPCLVSRCFEFCARPDPDDEPEVSLEKKHMVENVIRRDLQCFIVAL
jgi:hypothetical protein